MKVAIIGSGNVGCALGQALGLAGHQVGFGVRNPDTDQPAKMSISAAAKNADVTILAIPFGAVGEVIAAASGFAGKVLIDATNPLGMGEGGLGLTMGFETSGAEQIAALAPEAHVFKTFNQTGFEAIDSGHLRAARLLEPLAMLWIELARKRGLGSDFAFALQRRG